MIHLYKIRVFLPGKFYRFSQSSAVVSSLVEMNCSSAAGGKNCDFSAAEAESKEGPCLRTE